MCDLYIAMLTFIKCAWISCMVMETTISKGLYSLGSNSFLDSSSSESELESATVVDEELFVSLFNKLGGSFISVKAWSSPNILS